MDEYEELWLEGGRYKVVYKDEYVEALQVEVEQLRKAQGELSHNWNEHLHEHNAARYEHDYDLFKVVEAYVLKHTNPAPEQVERQAALLKMAKEALRLRPDYDAVAAYAAIEEYERD